MTSPRWDRARLRQGFPLRATRYGGQVGATSKRNDRPELAKALTHARRVGAVVVVAKPDRLSRNLAFLSALELVLIGGKVDFVCVDIPHAMRFTIPILAAVAEHERAMIRRRSKGALAAAKARGAKLGSARDGFLWGSLGADFSDNPGRMSDLF